MHKKIPKICTGCRVSGAKIYLYHSTKIDKARPHSEEWQTDTSVQKQWSMIYLGLAVFVPQTVNCFFDHLNVNVVLSFFNHNQFLSYFLENKWGKIEFSLQYS